MWGRRRRRHWLATRRQLRKRAELAENRCAAVRAELNAAYASIGAHREENRKLREAYRALDDAIKTLRANRDRLDAS